MIEKNKSHIDTCEIAQAYCNISISSVSWAAQGSNLAPCCSEKSTWGSVSLWAWTTIIITNISRLTFTLSDFHNNSMSKCYYFLLTACPFSATFSFRFLHFLSSLTTLICPHHIHPSVEVCWRQKICETTKLKILSAVQSASKPLRAPSHKIEQDQIWAWNPDYLTLVSESALSLSSSCFSFLALETVKTLLSNHASNRTHKYPDVRVLSFSRLKFTQGKKSAFEYIAPL